MRLKDNLKHYLKLREMTAAQLSRKCRQHGVPVSKATLSGWMAGGSVRNMDSLYVVSRVLGITIDDLLFGNPSRNGESEATSKGSKFLDLLIDDEWVSGIFEVRLRRIKQSKSN